MTLYQKPNTKFMSFNIKILVPLTDYNIFV